MTTREPKGKKFGRKLTIRQKMTLCACSSGLLLLPALYVRLSSERHSTVDHIDAEPTAVLPFYPKPEQGYVLQRSFIGIVQHNRKLELAFELSGTITKMCKNVGDTIKQGECIAELDPAQLLAERRALTARMQAAEARMQELQAGPRQEQVLQLEARVRRLEIERKNAHELYQRRATLVSENALAKEELTIAQHRAHAAEAAVQEAQHRLNDLRNGARPEEILAQKGLLADFEAQLEKIDVMLQKGQLLAPFDGIIVEVSKRAGEVVTAGVPVCTAIDPLDTEARIPVSTALLDRLQQHGTYLLYDDERPFKSRLKSILPEHDPRTRTVTVVFEFSTERPMAGRHVKLELQESVAAEGFWLPATAIQREPNGAISCYFLKPDTETKYPIAVRHALQLLHVRDAMVYARWTGGPLFPVIATGGEKIGDRQPLRLSQANQLQP